MLHARNICVLLWISFINCEILDFDNNMKNLLGPNAPSFSIAQFKKPSTKLQMFNTPNVKQWNMPSNNQAGPSLAPTRPSSFTLNFPEIPQPAGFASSFNTALQENKFLNGFHNLDCAYKNSPSSSSFTTHKTQNPNYYSVPNLTSGKFYLHPRTASSPLQYQNSPFAYNHIQQPQTKTFQDQISQSLPQFKQVQPQFSTNDITEQIQNTPNDISLAAFTAMKLKHPSSISIAQLIKDHEQKTQNKNMEDVTNQQRVEFQLQPQQDKRPNIVEPAKFEFVLSNPSKQFEESLQFQNGGIQREETVSTIINEPNDNSYGPPTVQKFIQIH